MYIYIYTCMHMFYLPTEIFFGLQFFLSVSETKQMSLVNVQLHYLLK